MKVYLLKDIEKVGLAGEIIKTTPGYANNYLLPRKLAVEVNASNEQFYLKKAKDVENRKEAIATKTSILAERIKNLKVTIKKKIHDDDRLYAAVNAAEIAKLLSDEGIKVTKSQIQLKKAIKTQGEHLVVVKLSNQLMPELKLKVVADKASN